MGTYKAHLSDLGFYEIYKKIRRLNHISAGRHISESILGNEWRNTQLGPYFNEINVEIFLCCSCKMRINCMSF